ncbi:MAG: Holliday junction branch migration protein RuvA [Alphaproteobacteria bacterium]|nr:Holliday junction branch migration protein RuvA [Alphaproteobacteria bacterium]
MIGKLIGTIDAVESNSVILMTTGGVGYKVHVTGRLGLSVGAACSLLIHTAVREDAFDLYGFQTAKEKELFLLLTSVQGVGNRVGLTILSSYDEDQIYAALATQDMSTFKSISGIGPKLATRIVTELKNKVSGLDAPLFTQTNKSAPIQTEAISALLNLGYKRFDVTSVVQRLLSETPDLSLEKLIPAALKELSSFS